MHYRFRASEGLAGLLLRRRVPGGLENLFAHIGIGIFERFLVEGQRGGGAVGAGDRGLGKLPRVADRGGDDLALVAEIVEQRASFTNEAGDRIAVLLLPAEKWADVGG